MPMMLTRLRHAHANDTRTHARTHAHAHSAGELTKSIVVAKATAAKRGQLRRIAKQERLQQPKLIMGKKKVYAGPWWWWWW